MSNRSAITGRYVSLRYALLHPRTTIREARAKRAKSKAARSK